MREHIFSPLLQRIHMIHFLNTMEKRTRIIGSTNITTYNDISGMIGLFSAVLKTTDLEATKEKNNYYDDFCDHQEGSLVSFMSLIFLCEALMMYVLVTKILKQ